MGYIVIGFTFFWLGLKYGELRDIMLARRISRLMAQQAGVQQDMDDYAKWQRQDAKIGKEAMKRDRSIHRDAGMRQDVPHDQESLEVDEEGA
ncbi:MAG: hypothetical protein K6T85_00795 [Gorillibacterium sp.]|nr:hypothetical protein [Gorillibacterium sp.]